MKMNTGRLILISLALIVLAQGVLALDISGTVYFNVNGTSVPAEGVMVNLTNSTNDVVGQGLTDASGAYSISTTQTVPPPMLLIAYMTDQAVTPESKPTNPMDSTQTIDIQFSFSCPDNDSDSSFASWCGGQDINDSDPSINPNATEVCNGVDDDCDGIVDENLTITYYADSDSDGFGDASTTIDACALPAGYVNNSEDCDDSNDQVKPNATEVCNGVDDDCNGQVDDGINCGSGSGSSGGGGSSVVMPPGYFSTTSDDEEMKEAPEEPASETEQVVEATAPEESPQDSVEKSEEAEEPEALLPTTGQATGFFGGEGGRTRLTIVILVFVLIAAGLATAFFVKSKKK